MATKEEWKEYFELLNNRKPTLEEFQTALKNGDISSNMQDPEPDNREETASDVPISADSRGETVSDAPISADSEVKGENMATKQEWKEYFELLNNRTPTLEEFQAAIRAGEIDEQAPQTAPQAAQNLTGSYGQQNPAPQPMSNLSHDQFDRAIQPDLLSAQPTATHQVTFGEAFKLFWQNYVNFKGRSSRREFWFMVLWGAIISIIPSILIWSATLQTLSAVNTYNAYSSTSAVTGIGVSWGFAGIGFILIMLFGLVAAVPAIALSVRRFRDAGISQVGFIGYLIIGGILLILQIIPILGALVWVAWAIYGDILFARPTDYYRMHKEPITDWLTATFGKK